MALRSLDLMIGDWVMVNRSECVADGGQYFEWQEVGRIMRLEDGIITVRYSDHEETDTIDWADEYEEDVKPYPITPEILEKNGFDKILQQPVFWMYEKYEEVSDGLLYRIKAHETLFRGLYFRIYNHADCELVDFCKQIEFVHELQHALRLCGIEKEIEL